MQRILLPALLAISLYTCMYPVPRRIKRQINCFTGSYTGLDTMINIHGFYRKMSINENRGLLGWKDGKLQKVGIDTTFLNFLFFEDGIFISGIGSAGISVSEYLNQLAKEGKSFDQRVFYQGIYLISGDTIKVQYITPGYGSVWKTAVRYGIKLLTEIQLPIFT